MIKTICFDMDDTLIPNHYTYHLPQLDACRMICIDLMWQVQSPSILMKRALEIQLEDIEKNQCVSKACFPNSWLKLYQECCEKAGRTPNKGVQGAIALTTEKYFLSNYQVFEGVKDFLIEIQNRGIKKICVTRGDNDIQTYKLQSSLLEGYFDNIEIVPIKTVDTYCQILDKYKLLPDETAMVGDSLKNDIIPALKVGLTAFHFINEFTNQEWDDPNNTSKNEVISYNKNYHSVKSLREIIDYLD